MFRERGETRLSFSKRPSLSGGAPVKRGGVYAFESTSLSSIPQLRGNTRNKPKSSPFYEFIFRPPSLFFFFLSSREVLRPTRAKFRFYVTGNFENLPRTLVVSLSFSLFRAGIFKGLKITNTLGG